MIFKLYVNTNVSMGNVLVCSIVIKSAYSSAMRMLGYPNRRITILTYKGPLKTLALAKLSFSFLSGGVNRIGHVESIWGRFIVMVGSRGVVGE